MEPLTPTRPLYRRQMCACARPGRAGRELMAADLYGAGQPVQCRLCTRLEADDEVVDAEPFVRVDRAGQFGEAGERPAAGLAGISQLPVHADGAAQRGRVAAFGLQRRAQASQPLAQPLVG